MIKTDWPVKQTGGQVSVGLLQAGAGHPTDDAVLQLAAHSLQWDYQSREWMSSSKNLTEFLCESTDLVNREHVPVLGVHCVEVQPVDQSEVSIVSVDQSEASITWCRAARSSSCWWSPARGWGLRTTQSPHCQTVSLKWGDNKVNKTMFLRLRMSYERERLKTDLRQTWELKIDNWVL